MTKKNKKGFTLTELIVVIAIIAILAAVLIPTSISFIRKAKRSNDEQVAAQMTKEIGWYCLDNDINQNNLCGTDIKTILVLRGYDLKPTTKFWTFIYNINKKKIELVDIDNNKIFAASIPNNPIDPTNIENGYFLIGEGISDIEKIVTNLCTLTKTTDYFKLINNYNIEDYKNFLKTFDPKHTLYVSNGNIITDEEYPIKSKIVFTSKTVHLPEIPNKFILNSTDTIPSTIKTTVSTNKSKIIVRNTIFVDKNTINKISIEESGGIVTYIVGDQFASSTAQAVDAKYSNIQFKYNEKGLILGIIAEQGKELTDGVKAEEPLLEEKVDNVKIQNEKILYQDYLNGNVASVTVVMTQRITISYFNEKGLCAYGEKEINIEKIITYGQYLVLKNIIL